ncbi:MAG: hypothetical protein AMK70_09455 [Nitrospira bacterium SG8_35_1]|nr:MAG: hypothetical protein AMK70_09455 [Nitrospira bacterium SG8_35_1]
MKSNNRLNTGLIVAFFLLIPLISSCGYKMVGSTFLPFRSIYIKQVVNRTYEPRLEERLHDALSREFISQGIEIRSSSADALLESEVTSFVVGAVGAVDEVVKEQELFMTTNIKLIEGERVTEFRDMRSPIRITFVSTGTVSDSVASKEAATDRACREIAKEIVGRIIMSYAK